MPGGRPFVGVVTVDDQASFRRVAREVIDATAGFELLGEAESGEEALALAGKLAPDLVVLDVCMPGMDGVETARRLSAANPAATIVLVSADEMAETACDSCGAAAFLPKQAFGQVALRRLWEVHGLPS